MRIEVLDEAEQDLLDGFEFYERQSPGLGDYFLDSLFADIESLYLYAGVHACISGTTGCSPSDSLSPSTIARTSALSVCMPFSTAGAIPRGLAAA